MQTIINEYEAIRSGCVIPEVAIWGEYAPDPRLALQFSLHLMISTFFHLQGILRFYLRVKLLFFVISKWCQTLGTLSGGISKFPALAADSVTCKLQPGSPETPHCRMLKHGGLLFPLGGIFLFLSLVFKSFLSVLVCFITWQEYFQMSLDTL